MSDVRQVSDQGQVVQQGRDEVSEYQDGRYVGSVEAAWRLFDFPMHGASPPVQRLQVHLEDEQSVTYDASTQETVEAAVEAGPPATTLTAWFEANSHDASGHHLKYTDFPTHFTWDKRHKRWNHRSSKRRACISTNTSMCPHASSSCGTGCN